MTTTFRAITRIYADARIVEIAEAFLAGKWRTVEQPLTAAAVLRLTQRGATSLALRIDGTIADFPCAELAVTPAQHTEELAQLTCAELIQLHQGGRNRAVWEAAKLAAAREGEADGGNYFLLGAWDTPNGGTTIGRYTRPKRGSRAKSGTWWTQKYSASRGAWGRAGCTWPDTHMPAGPGRHPACPDRPAPA